MFNQQLQHPPTALIVDDDQQVGSALRRSLKALAKEVVEAVSGENAVALLRGGLKPALVLSDNNVGAGMAGTEFLEEIRRLLPHAWRLLHTGDQKIDLVVAPGWALTVPGKPMEPDDLRRLLALLLETGAGSSRRQS